MSGATLEELVPMIDVPDLGGAIAFWESLGFELLGTDEPWQGTGVVHWAHLARDEVEVMLTRNDDMPPPRGVKLYLRVEDVDALRAELVGRGLEVAEPEDTFYGMREIWLCDPAGYEIGFGSPL